MQPRAHTHAHVPVTTITTQRITAQHRRRRQATRPTSVYLCFITERGAAGLADYSRYPNVTFAFRIPRDANTLVLTAIFLIPRMIRLLNSKQQWYARDNHTDHRCIFSDNIDSVFKRSLCSSFVEQWNVLGINERRYFWKQILFLREYTYIDNWW